MKTHHLHTYRIMHLQKRHIKCFAVTCTTTGWNTEQEDMGCMRMCMLARLKNSSSMLRYFMVQGTTRREKYVKIG